MKKLLRIVAIGFTSLLISALVAVWLLTTAPGENLVTEWLEGRLTADVGLRVSVIGFETNLLSRVRIDTLIIGSGTDTEKQPILYVGGIRIRYSLPQLLAKTVTLKEIAVDSVALAVEIDNFGRIGVPLLDTRASATQDSSEKTGIVCIDTISFNRIGLFYLDTQLPLSVELDGAVLSAWGCSDGSFSGRLTVADMLAVYDNLAFNVSNLEVAAAVDSGTLRLDLARANCEGLQLEASGELALVDEKTMALTVSANGSLDTLAAVISGYLELPALTASHVSAQGRIEGRLDDPRITLDASLSGIDLAGVAVQSAGLRAHYVDDHILLDTFHVATLSGTINGRATATLDTLGQTSLNLALDRIDIASLWRIIYGEASPYRGTLNGEISAEGQGGDLTSWTIEAAIAGKNLRYQGRSVPDLNGTANLESGRASGSLTHGVDQVYAQFEFADDSLAGTFSVSVLDLTALARFFDQPQLSGHLSAHGTIAGAYLNPAIHCTVEGSKISYRNFPFDSVFAELSYVDSGLTVINFVCEGRLDSIDPRHPPFDLDSISGSLIYAGRFSGPLDDLSGGLSTIMIEPRYGDYSIDSLSIEATLDGSRFEVTRLEASRGGLRSRLKAAYDTSTATGSFDIQLYPLLAQSGTGRLPDHDTAAATGSFGSVGGVFKYRPDSDFSAMIRGHGLWLGLLALVTGDTTVSDGNVDFDLAIAGPWFTPNAVLNATIRSIRVSGCEIDSIATHLRVDRDALVLDSLRSYARGHTARASGRLELSTSRDSLYEIRDDARLAAELDTRDFELSVLKDMIVPAGDISGTVSAALRISGTTASPTLDGWLVAENGRILLNEDSQPLESIWLFLSFADSVLTIDSATGTVADITIQAHGSLTTSTFESALIDLDVAVGSLGRLSIDGTVSDTSVHLDVFSDSLNLATFQPFMTELDSLQGQLACRMLIVGTPSAPQIDGSLRISSLSLQAPRHYVKMSHGQADIRFDKSRVMLDSASAALNGGRLVLFGFLTHHRAELSDVGLTLHGSRVTLQKPGVYTASVDSTTLRYGKQKENYVLDGDIVLGEARLMAGIRATSILPWVESMEAVDLELPELIARSRLDVRIRESDRLWVDNNLARIRLRAEVGVIGTPLRPNFTGLVQVEEGYLLYLDRRFRVNEGTVFFNDPARFNPDVNLDASAQVTVYRRTTPQPYTVYIKAEGLLDQLRYGLYSEPPLDKPDIVALLTLGATRSELAGTGEGNEMNGLTGVLRDRAAMLASQTVSGYLSRRAGSLFGFNEFTIEGNLLRFDGSWGPQLVASKSLSQKVAVTYSTTVGHLNDQAMRLGYRLTPRLSLQGETDRQGRAGLDLKYGFMFK